jgi:hypothetical protein
MRAGDTDTLNQNSTLSHRSGHGHGHSHGGQFSIGQRDRRGGDPVLFRLLADHKADRLEPVPVPLPIHRLARQATALRSIAGWMALLMGLRLTEGDADALPFSTSLCCRLMGWDPTADKTRASTCLKRLEEKQVIRYAGSLEPDGKPDGTRCFQPCGFDLEELFEYEDDPAGQASAADDRSGQLLVDRLIAEFDVEEITS